MRILAIDPGERRVGLAVSDELGLTAQGLPTFDLHQGSLMEHLAELVKEYGVTRIVVGNPVLLSGAEGRESAKARRLASEIERSTGVEVVLWDERLSSVEAERVLAGQRAGKEAVDRVSAALILQSYLDYLRRPRGS